MELTKPNQVLKRVVNSMNRFLSFFFHHLLLAESDPFRRRHVGVDREMCRTVLYVGLIEKKKYCMVADGVVRID